MSTVLNVYRKLTVRADQSLLSPQATFPVYIDPTYSKFFQKWIPVSKLKPDTKWTSGNAYPRDIIRIGSNFDNYADVWACWWAGRGSSCATRRRRYEGAVYLSEVGPDGRMGAPDGQPGVRRGVRQDTIGGCVDRPIPSVVSATAGRPDPPRQQRWLR